MILVKDKERAIRTIEAFNALSVVLPIYDPELRGAFRGAFKIDMYHLLPKFFQDLARLAIRHDTELMMYLDYVEKLIEYIRNPTAKLPVPENAYEAAFTECREEAEMMMNSWYVRTEKKE